MTMMADYDGRSPLIPGVSPLVRVARDEGVVKH